VERRAVVRVPVTSSDRALAWLALLAIGACAATLVSGLEAALTYSDALEPAVRSLGLTLQHLRPIHESCAFAWVFLGGVTVVHFYLLRASGPPTAGMRRRLIAQTVLWTAAGLGILTTLSAGSFTGREYLGYRPLFSACILGGWILFAWNYFGRVGIRLRGRPVYIYMWTVAIPLFVIAFLEGHLYLFDALSDRPPRDIAVQWKSAGTLVGSFNLLAYGSIMYIAGCVRGDDRYAHSRTAFALFGVGVLNTFTNYGHHTYHVPQSAWIHWISFVVSMLEIVILLKVLLDLLGLRRATPVADDLRVVDRFARLATIWTSLLLLLALLISVPPLNALIHGTHVVVAHSMGSMIGIDSMILWAAFAYILRDLARRPEALARRRVRAAVPLINLFLLVFLAAYLARGVAAGWARYAGPSAPDLSRLVQAFPLVMVHAGLGLAAAVLWILGHWVVALWPVARRGR